MQLPSRSKLVRTGGESDRRHLADLLGRGDATDRREIGNEACRMPMGNRTPLSFFHRPLRRRAVLCSRNRRGQTGKRNKLNVVCERMQMLGRNSGQASSDAEPEHATVAEATF